MNASLGSLDIGGSSWRLNACAMREDSTRQVFVFGNSLIGVAMGLVFGNMDGDGVIGFCFFAVRMCLLNAYIPIPIG